MASRAVELRDEVVAEGRAVEPLLTAGDCLLFENRCFHSVGVNTSGRVSHGP